MAAGDHKPGQLRDCRRCHRSGYRGFVPSGDYGWECSNDRACAKRTAKQVTVGEWMAIAHLLASRVFHWQCDQHPLSEPDPVCAYCEDRRVYREYLALRARAGLRQVKGPLETRLDAAPNVPIDQILEGPFLQEMRADG